MLTDDNQIFRNCFIIHCHLTNLSSQINKCILFGPNELFITLSTLLWYHGGMITGGLIRKRILSMTSSRGTAHKKLQWIDRFGHANELTRTILMIGLWDLLRNSTIHFRMYLYFRNMFRESHGFISVPVTSSNNFVTFTN